MTQQPPPQEPTPTAPRRAGALERARKGWKYLSMFSEVATPSNLVIFVVALGLLAVGALGGWERVRAEAVELPALEAGKPVNASPLRITVQDVWQTTQPPKAIFSSKGERIYMVRGAVRSEHGEPAPPSETLVRMLTAQLPGCQLFGTPRDEQVCKASLSLRTHDLDDAASLQRMGDLQPGVPQGFVLVFSQNPKAPALQMMVLTASSMTHRTSSLEETKIWADETPIGTLTLPVRQWDENSWSRK